MRILIIHQNFPGQFRQLVPYLLRHGHELVAICSHDRPLPMGVKGWRYSPPNPPREPMQLGQHLWFESLQRASSVTYICSKLNDEGWVPDRILAHTGWGETLGISEIWPFVPQIVWPELWTLPQHGGHGIDPLLPKPSIDQNIEQLGRNIMTRVALQQSEAWVMPTKHQARSLPNCFQNDNLHIIHEGIDTTVASPRDDMTFSIRGKLMSKSTPIVTFVNRNLERLRGFDVFMRSLPELMALWPDLQVIIVGDNEKGYGHPHPSGQPLRSVMMNELSGKLDLERLYFLGRVPYDHLIALMQVSSVHVYLSYPFVLGWSLLEAMSCGCTIVGSHGMPVEEVIEHNVNGVLVPMDNPQALSSQISHLLSNPKLRFDLGRAARVRALDYDINQTLPKIVSVICNP